jgi:regulatory protein
VRISKIETQKKNRDRVSVYIDGEYRFGLTKSLALKYDLAEDQEITEEEIKNVLYQAEKEKIRERAFRLLNFRDRSVQEMTERLLKLGYDLTLVEETVGELVAENTLDDRRFSRAFTDDYTNLKPKGNLFLRRELKHKKVAAEIIEELTKTRDEKNLIRKLVAAKLGRYDRLDPKDRQKIIRYLAYRGFAFNNILDVLGGADE